jgi:hypothetical protein
MDHYKTIKIARQWPDLILIDIQLPIMEPGKAMMAYMMLTALVSAQPGSGHVPTSFPDTFPLSGNCRFFRTDSRFSCERANQLGLQGSKH